MKRQLIALIMMLAIGVQGSVAAFAAGAPAMQTDCQTAAQNPNLDHKCCCPHGLHAASCCLDACTATVAVTGSPASLIWYRGSVPAPQFGHVAFVSRGDSPLIRPPIL